jgi:hypothetical protein
MKKLKISTFYTVVIPFIFYFGIIGASGWAQETLSDAKPIPRMQVIPLPDHQASFQWDGVELTRYYFDSFLYRPFLYPLNGPSGRSLTRMGHPHDPETHSHHNSVWISHNSVDGVSFWDDKGKGKIIHKRLAKYEDGENAACRVSDNEWATTDGKVLMLETNRTTVQPLDDREWLCIIDLQFKPKNDSVILGQSPFGMIGVRMAKTIGVNDGGGRILNSEGGVNEKDIFWKRANWVDYSGPIMNSKNEGVTLFDHPQNLNFPSYFHVRNDGWMGASLTFDGTRTLQINQPLALRYGLYIHNGVKEKDKINAQWQQFAKTQLPKMEK